MPTIDDLKPKTFTITVRGVELECKPLRLSHSLIISKISDVFQNPDKYDAKQIIKAQEDIDFVFSDVIPALKFELDMSTTLEVIMQLMETIQPDDDKFLKENGVDLDPKEQESQETPRTT